MVDLEPFKYQASTNIKEHNEIVDKVNEIVGVINDINLDGLGPRLTADEANIKKNTDDITHLKISDTEHTAEISTLESNVDNHAREITAIKAVDAKQNSDISEMNTVVDALTKELPTEITLYRDGTGKIKVQVTKEDNTTFDSNTLDMVIPYQYSIISGTSARSFKLDITTSDGNHIITNDFLIPEGGGTDITVTSVTLIKDPTNSNKVKVSIGLSEGTSLESGYVEMVNTVSGTFANNKLTITVNGVSSVPISIDATGTVYTAGNGITITSGTISIDGSVVALKSDISDMETKTNANATYATKTALNNLQNSVGDAFSAVAIGADGKSLDFTALDGQINNIILPLNDVNTIVNINFSTLVNNSNYFEWDTSNLTVTIKKTLKFKVFCYITGKWFLSEHYLYKGVYKSGNLSQLAVCYDSIFSDFSSVQRIDLEVTYINGTIKGIVQAIFPQNPNSWIAGTQLFNDSILDYTKGYVLYAIYE